MVIFSLHPKSAQPILDDQTCCQRYLKILCYIFIIYFPSSFLFFVCCFFFQKCRGASSPSSSVSREAQPTWSWPVRPSGRSSPAPSFFSLTARARLPATPSSPSSTFSPSARKSRDDEQGGALSPASPSSPFKARAPPPRRTLAAPFPLLDFARRRRRHGRSRTALFLRRVAGIRRRGGP